MKWMEPWNQLIYYWLKDDGVTSTKWSYLEDPPTPYKKVLNRELHWTFNRVINFME